MGAALDQAAQLGADLVGVGNWLADRPGFTDVAAELAAERGLQLVDGQAYRAAMLLRAA